VLSTVKGDYVILGELYTNEEGTDKGTGATIEEIKRQAVELEIARGFRYQGPDGRWICTVRKGPADSSIFDPLANRGENADSLADEFATQIKINGETHRGLQFEKADKSDGSRQRGWATIRGKLYATLPPHARPGLYITADCPELVRTLKHLPRDPKKEMDCPRNAADHLPDALRYLLGRLAPGEATVRFSSLNDRMRRA
jgi:hypothetical protein